MERSAIRLPGAVRPPFEVYVNGVRQQEGSDFTVRERVLVFDRELSQEGKLGLWRWFLGAWGIGTYRKHDGVDVSYTTADGRPMVAHNLPVEPRASS